MYQLLIAIVAFIIAIGLLVAVHEFGHFWVARRFGIKVLRFSIGFGRPLYRWYDKLGTEYVISAIPLGGYVALFGERGGVPPIERPMAFGYKPVGVRMCVLAAGPAFNLLFAIIAYWILFLMGTTVYAPILGHVTKDSIADLAGLKAGQEIVSVEGKPTPSWEAVSIQLLSHIGEDKTIALGVKENAAPDNTVNNKETKHDKSTHLSNTHPANISANTNSNPIEIKTLDLGHWSDNASQGEWLSSMGLSPVDPVPPIIGKVLEGYPAAEAGLLEGDKILSVNNQPIQSRLEFVEAVQSKANKKVSLNILRADKTLNINIVPTSKVSETTGKEGGFIGVEFQTIKEIPQNLLRTERFGIFTALSKAFKRTYEYSIITLEVLKKMIVGQVSVRHISGPLTIAKYAGQTASIGFKHFLDFLGMVSVSLGIINILPIPILDGGHFMYCVYEFFTGKRVSEAAQNVGVMIGGILLLGFMSLAFYNDIINLFP